MIKTEIISIDPKRIEKDKIETIVAFLNNDGVIAYPTDTFYGLGVNCYSEKAVKKIFDLKGRDTTKALLVVISGRSMLQDLVESIPFSFEPLAENFWPGPLTLIFKASERLPGIVSGGSKTIGVRWPDFVWLQALIRRAGFPLTATSANLSEEKEIIDPSRLVEEFEGKIDLIVDGGPAPGGKPSTVVDISSGGLSILREGAIPSSALRRYQKGSF
jgi:L-threonylcarbamoyladenylate synthase